MQTRDAAEGSLFLLRAPQTPRAQTVTGEELPKCSDTACSRLLELTDMTTFWYPLPTVSIEGEPTWIPLEVALEGARKVEFF